MEYIADLHIHSPYSRATSPGSTLTGLAAWAGIKGIQLIASGDFTHPAWFNTLKEELVPAEPGLFRLKNGDRRFSALPGQASGTPAVRFILSAEISCIYKRHARLRKVHNLLYVPDFASAERINSKLARVGNIESDGRPILGLDSRNLLEILLESTADGFLVPAHIWTPWFSMFGSKSGFDSVEECFGDLTEQIFALETGLSSDPSMNRLVSGLDRFALISNSDSHSPSKLGREANLFSTDLNYYAMREALKNNRRDTFLGTVEFFPEAGKYHYDGHRACNLCLPPFESRQLPGFSCPVCRKPLTIGVQHRVIDLADREQPLFAADAPEAFHLIPLQELLGELLGTGEASKKVLHNYARSVELFGSELNLLLHTGIDKIAVISPLLAEAVQRLRTGDLLKKPGFDGNYGTVKIFGRDGLPTLARKATSLNSPGRAAGIELFRG